MFHVSDGVMDGAHLPNTLPHVLFMNQFPWEMHYHKMMQFI